MARDKTDANHAATTATRAPSVEYSEAVARTRKFLEGLMFGKEWQAKCCELLGLSMLREKPGELLTWAESDAEGFDALRLGIAWALRHGLDHQIRPEVRAWLVRYLRGEAERPKSTAGRASAERLHVAIWVAVGRLVLDGMIATRNDSSEPTSACDAVAEALKEHGLTPATFDGVKRVWLDGEKRKRTPIQPT